MQYVPPILDESEERPLGDLVSAWVARALPPKPFQRPRTMTKPMSRPMRSRSLAPIERRKGGNRRGAELERRLSCRRVIHAPVVLDTRAKYDRRHGSRRRHEATVRIDIEA